MNEVLRRARELLENQPEQYIDAYLLAYQTMADTALQAWDVKAAEAQVLQEMYKRVSGTAFEALYRSLRMKIDAEERRRHIGGTAR